MGIRHTRVVDGLTAATPFVGPEALERRSGSKIELRLGANESPFGPSPQAVAAMQAKTEIAQFYGDPEGVLLRRRLSELLSVPAENIVLGAGIDELLGQACRLVVEPDDVVVTTLGSYPTFDYGAIGCGARILRVPYLHESVDVSGLLNAAAESKAKLIYVANPDNPSGSWLEPRVIQQLIENLPSGCLLLLDEAYVEFAPSALPLDVESPSVIRVRTFSKAHGMAGLRIAYAVSHSYHCMGLNKIRFHFAVNSVALAGALASLNAPEHVEHVVHETKLGRQRMAVRFAALGFRSLPSHTNFLTVDIGSRTRVEAILERLLSLGVFIRKPGLPPLDTCIRVTVGRVEEQDAFFRAFEQVLRETEHAR